MIRFLYSNPAGRALLRVLGSPRLSQAAGNWLDTRRSLPLIPPFIAMYHIDMEEVRPKGWESFNDFFTRKLVDGARIPDPDPQAFISPCDGLLKACEISDGEVVTVKDVPYTAAGLLRSRRLAEEFEGGTVLVFRLTPSHYHRYIYPESGEKSREFRIPGVLHTVRPVATESVPVFAQNSRAFCIIKSAAFGPVVFMQVGALLVGRIVTNDPGARSVSRGDEAGRFEYGGSTIVVLVKKGRLELRDDIKKASAENREVSVKLGEAIGRRTETDPRA